MTTPVANLMMTPDRVRDEIRERILGVVRDRARAIYLYGSRAKGTARAKSDWDVAVVLRGPLEDWAAESLRLSALFYPSSYAVDLQVFEDEEFSLDATVPGTLPYTVALRGERLYDHAR